jgi:hypothetical protein
MTSTSETGHAVNIANFKVLMERCKEFGGVYNPPRNDLSVASMMMKLEYAEQLHKEYISALEETKIPINDREILFVELGKLVVRTYNLFLSTLAPEESKRDAKGYLVKITGRNVKVPKLEDGVTPVPNYRSNSQKSFAQRTENFDKLVNLYKADLNYCPNEAALQVASLETMVENLRAANDKVYAVVAKAEMRRMARDHALYDAGVGIIDLAFACKMYVKGLFGGLSPEAMSVVSIKFRRILRMNAV